MTVIFMVTVNNSLVFEEAPILWWNQFSLRCSDQVNWILFLVCFKGFMIHSGIYDFDVFPG